jgi:hypothetical protein
MTMLYGLVGAHRVGKTELGRRLSDEYEFAFHETRMSDALQALGIDPQADMPFEHRLKVQEALLETLLIGYAQARQDHPGEDVIIVDRTPLDVLAYTMADLQRETLKSGSLNDLMGQHVVRAFQTTNFNFAGLTLVQPGIPLIPDPGKAPANTHYQEAIAAQMLGVVCHPRNNVNSLILSRKKLSYKSRISAISEQLLTIISHDEHTLERVPAQQHSISIN